MDVDRHELCFTYKDSSFVSDNDTCIVEKSFTKINTQKEKELEGGKKKSIRKEVEEKENERQPRPIALRLSLASKLFVPLPFP